MHVLPYNYSSLMLIGELRSEGHSPDSFVKVNLFHGKIDSLNI